MVRSWPVRHISAASASIHAMSASEIGDTSTVVGANDDDPADHPNRREKRDVGQEFENELLLFGHPLPPNLA